MKHLALALILGLSIGGLTAFRGNADPTVGAAKAAPAAAALSGPAISQVETGHWWSNAGAVINRHNDRDLFGGATANTGAMSPAGPPSTDWLTAWQIGNGIPAGQTWIFASQDAILTSANPTAHFALTLGADTLRSSGDAVALSAECVNRNGARATNCWALYGDAKKTTTASAGVYAIEVDPGSTVPTRAADPYQQGDVIGIQDACGGQYPIAGQVNCSAAMQIEPNPAMFKQGIVFANGSIAAGGYSLLFPAGMLQAWYRGGGSVDGAFGDISGTLTSTLPMAVVSAGGAAMTFTNPARGRSMVIGVLDGVNAVIDTPASGDFVVSDGGRATARINAGAASFNEAIRPPQTSYANLPSFDPSPVIGDYLVISDAQACSVGAAVTSGGGSGHACPAIYDGAGWMPAVGH